MAAGIEATGIKAIAKESIGWSIAFSVLLILAGFLALVAPLMAGITVAVVVAWIFVFSGLMHLVFAWHLRGAGAILWEILVGLAYLVIGWYMFAHPAATLIALTLVLGCYLLFKGVAEIIGGIAARPLPGAGWLIFDGILSLLISAMIWFHLPSSAAWVVGTLVGCSILFSGISRLMLSLTARKVLHAV